MSPFFRDELLAPVLHFVSVDRGERGLGRTCISITMKFINEVVNGGVTIILFVVPNLVCVPKKRNLSIFRGLKGAHKNS